MDPVYNHTWRNLEKKWKKIWPNAPPVGNAVVETPRAPKVSEPWSLGGGRPPTADCEGGHCHWDPISGTSPGPAKGHAQTHGLRSITLHRETPTDLLRRLSYPNLPIDQLAEYAPLCVFQMLQRVAEGIVGQSWRSCVGDRRQQAKHKQFANRERGSDSHHLPVTPSVHILWSSQ